MAKGQGLLAERILALAKQHGVSVSKDPDLLAALGNTTGETDRTAQVAQICAALVIEFLHQRPLRLDIPEETVKNLMQAESALTVSLLAPAALACGLASVGAADELDSDPLEIAALAVEARLDRIIAACRSADPIAELTPVFAMLLFHLR